MFGFDRMANLTERAAIAALGRSFAIIEFDAKGKILSANAKFCEASGHREADLVGKSYDTLVRPEYAQSEEYRQLWAALRRGDAQTVEAKRLDGSGRDVWVRATYTPIVGPKGDVLRIFNFTTDITKQKLEEIKHDGILRALSRAQATIEFTTTGEILDANENFLKVIGYELSEIKGRNHSMFVEPQYAASAEYQAFWSKLRAGEFISDSFRRLGKGGKPVWIDASYNPIFDFNGKVTSVIKFAVDKTDLTHLEAALGRMREKDIATPISTPFKPMFEKLRVDFNASQEELKSTIAEIAGSVEMVDSGGHEIASAADDLSRRTEQQAASLEQTSAALEEVTATVKRTTEGAVQARSVVSQARGDAENSGDIVRRAVEAMGRIEKSSSEIGKIIGVIDEIAFQTNLLALNAGVEAARAGDAGRGFAVVASEVRALAQRSADAAKEIKALVGTSAREVGEGVKLVAETGDALTRIGAKVSEINDVVAGIAAGAEEQSTALQEVSIAVGHMDQATQQNAAMAEQAAAAAKSTLQETQRLSQMISRFKVGAAAASAPPRRELASPPSRTAPRAVTPAPAPTRSPARTTPPRPAPRPAAKKVVNGPAVSGGDQSWDEF